MKILFTKLIDKKWVSDSLGSDFHVDFIDTFKIQHIKTVSFKLKNHSLIFDNPESVEAFFKNGFKPNERFSERDYNKIYAIGIDTKKELRKNNFGAFKLFKSISEFSNFMYSNSSLENFLYFCGNKEYSNLVENLKLQNLNFKKVAVYQTELLYPKIEEQYQSVVFFSPTDVQSCAKHNNWGNLKVFSANLETTKELKKHLSNKIITSSKNTIDDIIKLIRKENLITN